MNPMTPKDPMDPEKYRKVRYATMWQEHVSFDDAKKYHVKNVARLRKAVAEYLDPDRPLRVLAVHGSGRSSDASCAKELSNSQALLRTGLKAVPPSGVEVEEVALRDYQVENCNCCVSEREWVLTADGWRRLGDLRNGDVAVVDGTGAEHKPLRYLPRGVRPVFRVVTRQGYSVTATADHEVYLTDGRKARVDKLRPGDRLALKVPGAGRLRAFPAVSLDVPWGLRFGELLGFLVGNGSFGRCGRTGAFRVSAYSHEPDREALDRVAGTFADLFGPVRATVRVYDYRRAGKTFNRYDLRDVSMARLITTNGRLGAAMEALGVRKGGIPDALYLADGETIRGFLRGLFTTDGGVVNATSRAYSYIAFSSKHRGMLEDVQRMLLLFGIRSSISKTNLYIYRQADSTAFMREIGFFLARKTAAFRAGKHARMSWRRFPRDGAEFVRTEPAGDAWVADLSMPADHSFVAGGVRVSNCYSTTSGLCNMPCSCWPMDPMQDLYPKVLRSDVLLCSTGVNQATMSTRLKAFSDRLVSLDGGFFIEELPMKDQAFKGRMQALELLGSFAYDQRLYGRVAAYFISSKDESNEMTTINATPALDPEWRKDAGYIDLTAAVLKDGYESYGYFHADPWYAGLAAPPQRPMALDKAAADVDAEAQDRASKVVLAALALAGKMRRDGPPPFKLDRKWRT